MAKKTKEPVEIETTVVEPVIADTEVCTCDCCGDVLDFKEVFNVKEASEYLGVSKNAIKNLIADEAIPCKKITDRKVIFSRRALEEWVYNGDK